MWRRGEDAVFGGLRAVNDFEPALVVAAEASAAAPTVDKYQYPSRGHPRLTILIFHDSCEIEEPYRHFFWPALSDSRRCQAS